jgi:RecA-family ATPase
MKLMTIAELNDAAKASPTDYLVQGLFKEGSFNIVSGESKSGKSTLVRYLAKCVVHGLPFLGEKTKQGEVLLVCPDESDTTELAAAFERLGITDGLRLSYSPVNQGGIATELEDCLKKHPKTKLIVLDTLIKSAQFEDLNDYAKTVNDLSAIERVASTYAVTIVALHHMNKSNSGSVAAGMMGSAALPSVALTTLEVSTGPHNSRYIRTIQRYGRSRERTEVIFDYETGALRLGLSTSQARETSAACTRNERESAILNFVRIKGTVKAEDIRKAIGCNGTVASDALRTLVQRGELAPTGSGKKGDPFIYSVVSVPFDRVAA